MSTQQKDAFDEAMDAEYVSSRAVFGQVQVDVMQCVLQKGVGKIPFDPNFHPAESMRHAITIAILPLPGSPIEFPTERNMLAESKEWASVTKPSLRALNADLRGVNGQWAQVELVPTGRTYTNKRGEEKEATTIKFVAIFHSEDACLDAANHFFYPDRYPAAGTAPARPAAAPPQTNGGSDVERQTAAKFLPALYKASGGDIDKLAQLIAGNPLTSKFFDMSSPEVVELIVPF